jgi:hypothetical protein
MPSPQEDQMAAKFNPVPFATLAALLVSKGFEQKVVRKEVVFDRAHHGDTGFRVIVYTSCGVDGVAVRKKGKDAIRVCLVHGEGSESIGVMSATRVNRCGTTAAILDRIHTRARDMYREANRMARGSRCGCGAPRYTDSGKCVRRHKCCQKSAA